MVTTHAIFETASTILVLVASSFYASNIIRRKIIPTKAAWLLWAMIAVLVALGMYRAGTLNWQAGSVAVVDTALFGLVCLYAIKWEWSPFDLVCMGLASTAILLWQTTSNPDWAIALGLAAAFIASLPLFWEVRKDPTIEKPLPWACMTASSVCELASLQDWSWQSWVQPAVYLLVPAIVLVLLIPGDDEPVTFQDI